jgi:GT2 family glycosyltransferase
MEELKILVVIPVHDRLDFVYDALASAEQQTRPADKIVVTGNVGPGVITDAPLTERLNRAINESDADAFTMLCDDDMLHPTFLEKTEAALERTGADIAYTDTHYFGDLKLSPYMQPKTRPFGTDLDKHNTAAGTTLCRRSLWYRVGGFAEVPLFDWDYAWRCWQAGAKAAYVEEALVHCRIHAGQATWHQNIGAAFAASYARQQQLRADRSWIRS